MRIANTICRALGAWLIAAGLAAAQPSGARTEAAAAFAPDGVDWIVPFSEGGGSDVWARFLAPLLERHLPGNPQVRIVNEFGGGGTRGANLFASRARPDGLMILGTSGSTQFPYLLGDRRVRYAYEDWSVLMASPTGGVVYVSADLGLESWEDIARLQGRRLRFASQGATSLDLVPLLAFRLLGLDVNYIFGYPGRNDGLLAMQRGEVNIDYQTTAAFLRNVMPLVAQGQAVPLMSWGVVGEDGAVRRDPTFPDLPTVEEVHELLHGRPPSGPDYTAYRLFAIAGFAAQKLVVVPRQTPQPIRDIWLEAWRGVLNDPEFIAHADEILGVYEQFVGPPAERLARLATMIDPEVKQHVLDLLAREYSIRLVD